MEQVRSSSLVEPLPSVRFQLASDIHLEFLAGKHRNLIPTLPVKAPILALLGDIGYPNSTVYQEFLLHQADKFEHVLVIAGNHEYYKQSVQAANRTIAEISKKKENIHFLNRTSVQIGNVLFLGCTLWTNIPDEKEEEIEMVCNDYRCIYTEQDALATDSSETKLTEKEDNETEISGDGEQKTRRITAKDTKRWHREELEWILGEVEKVKRDKPDLKVVVLTHHAPSKWRCLEPFTRDRPHQFMTYTNLESHFGPPIVVWAFGHTHWSSDNIINGTRVVSNQYGYITYGAFDGKGSNWFRPEWVIDINESEQAVTEYLQKQKLLLDGDVNNNDNSENNTTIKELMRLPENEYLGETGSWVEKIAKMKEAERLFAERERQEKEKEKEKETEQLNWFQGTWGWASAKVDDWLNKKLDM
jgi:predicted phosphohydrolase